MLRQKHPLAATSQSEALLPDQPAFPHPVIYENIDADAIKNAAIRTKGGSGPSGLDGDGWRKILTSSSFCNAPDCLCDALSKVARKLSTVEDSGSSIESFLACRLIPLDKNPGLRPIGVGKVIRRRIGKAIMKTACEFVTDSIGSLQVSAGQDAGIEAAVHSMRNIFEEEDTEAVLLTNAKNTFNVINRKVFLHNIRVACPEIAIFVTNCYSKPARLIVIGGTELSSAEGTTQRDPVAMAVYATAIIPLLLLVLEQTDPLPGKPTKSVALADDVTAGGSIENLDKWWKHLNSIGSKFGYYIQETKCWLS